MIKNATFCDICKKHVESPSDGFVLFSSIDDEVLERAFDKAGNNDICICFECRDSIKRLKLFNT